MGRETNSTSTQDGPVCKNTPAQTHLRCFKVQRKLVPKCCQLSHSFAPQNQTIEDPTEQESEGTFSTLVDPAPASLVPELVGVSLLAG